MTHAQSVIDEFRNAGAQLSPNSGRLHVTAPRGRVTPKMLARARRFKAEILSILKKPRLRVWRVVVETDGRLEGMVYIDHIADDRDSFIACLHRQFGQDRVKSLQLINELE